MRDMIRLIYNGNFLRMLIASLLVCTCIISDKIFTKDYAMLAYKDASTI